MFRSLTSGEMIDPRWTRFSFPATGYYDVLRGLDYLRSAGVAPDGRVAEAIELVETRRHQNGRWPLNGLHPDRVPFDMEAGIGKASAWNTLRALRVLDWYGNRASATTVAGQQNVAGGMCRQRSSGSGFFVVKRAAESTSIRAPSRPSGLSPGLDCLRRIAPCRDPLV
jgi:hypothetical protein